MTSQQVMLPKDFSQNVQQGLTELRTQIEQIRTRWGVGGTAAVSTYDAHTFGLTDILNMMVKALNTVSESYINDVMALQNIPGVCDRVQDLKHRNSTLQTENWRIQEENERLRVSSNKMDELYVEITRLKGKLLTEMDQAQEYNRAWQWSRARISQLENDLMTREETIREQRDVIDKLYRHFACDDQLQNHPRGYEQRELLLRAQISELERKDAELQRRLEEYGNIEIQLRTELSETQEKLQDALWQVRH